MTVNDAGIIKSSAHVPAQTVADAIGASMQVLVGPDEGAERYITRKFTLAPGGRIPKHRHADIEHEQYVLAGEMQLGLGDAAHTVREGDAVFIPAGTAHWYENNGDTPVQFLCIIPKTADYGTEWLE